MTLPVNAFIARFLQHVLPRGFAKIRSYGLLSPARREDLELARHLLQLHATQRTAAATTPESQASAATPDNASVTSPVLLRLPARSPPSRRAIPAGPRTPMNPHARLVFVPLVHTSDCVPDAVLQPGCAPYRLLRHFNSPNRVHVMHRVPLNQLSTLSFRIQCSCDPSAPLHAERIGSPLFY